MNQMHRVTDNADRNRPGWSEDALLALIESARIMKRGTAEQLRGKAIVDHPHDYRAWGSVVREAARQGFIVSDGYAKARSSNDSPKIVWKYTGKRAR